MQCPCKQTHEIGENQSELYTPHYRAKTAAATTPPSAAANDLPAPAVTKGVVPVVVGAEPPDAEGRVAVVRVVEAEPPLPVVGAEVGAVLVVVGADEELLVGETLLEEELLVDEEDEELLVVVGAELEVVGEVVLLPPPLPPASLKGNEYWKMLVSESSWSLKPYVSKPTWLASGVHVYLPSPLSMLAMMMKVMSAEILPSDWKYRTMLLLTDYGRANVQSFRCSTLQEQNAHRLPIVINSRVPDDLEGLASSEGLTLGRASDGVEVRGLREGSADEGEERGGVDGELHLGLCVVG